VIEAQSTTSVNFSLRSRIVQVLLVVDSPYTDKDSTWLSFDGHVHERMTFRAEVTDDLLAASACLCVICRFAGYHFEGRLGIVGRNYHVDLVADT